MKAIRPCMTAFAACALLTAQAAAAKTACITEPEVSGMLAFAMPAVLTDVAATCRPHLAGDGYLATKGPEMIQRFAARKAAAWPIAKGAFLKLGRETKPGLTGLAAALPDSALQPFVEGMAAKLVGTRFKPENCGTFETVAELLDPLPPEGTTRLLGTLIGWVQRGSTTIDKSGKSAGLPIPICPAG